LIDKSLNNDKKALVIGGGFGGCTAIHRLKSAGWHVTLVHPSTKLGAGVRTQFISGHPFTFGPRHFLTHNSHVYEYLASHLDMRLCAEHQFFSYVSEDSNFYSYPIHYDDIARMPEAEQIYKELEKIETRFQRY